MIIGHLSPTAMFLTPASVSHVCICCGLSYLFDLCTRWWLNIEAVHIRQLSGWLKCSYVSSNFTSQVLWLKGIWLVVLKNWEDTELSKIFRWLRTGCFFCLWELTCAFLFQQHSLWSRNKGNFCLKTKSSPGTNLILHRISIPQSFTKCQFVF